MQCSKNAQSSVDSKYIIFKKNDENFAYSTNTITSIIFIYIYIYIYIYIMFEVHNFLNNAQSSMYTIF